MQLVQAKAVQYSHDNAPNRTHIVSRGDYFEVITFTSQKIVRRPNLYSNTRRHDPTFPDLERISRQGAMGIPFFERQPGKDFQVFLLGYRPSRLFLGHGGRGLYGRGSVLSVGDTDSLVQLEELRPSRNVITSVDLTFQRPD